MTEVSLGKSKEDYLEAILIQNQKRGWCRVIDIAGQTGYSMASVSIAIRKLEEEGFVIKENTGEVKLTDEGLAIAGQTLEKHEFFHELLRQAGIDEQTAQEEACLIEHAVSYESYRKIFSWLSGRTGLDTTK